MGLKLTSKDSGSVSKSALAPRSLAKEQLLL